jgi:hypothetical protein
MDGRVASGNCNIRRTSTTKNLIVEDANLQAFYNRSLAAAYPDGGKSLLAADSALTQIKANITAIHQFWESTAKAGQSYLANKQNGFLTAKEAEQITVNWTGYQEATTKAVASIRTTNAAILIEAVGASSNPGGSEAMRFLQGEPKSTDSVAGDEKRERKGRFGLGWIIFLFQIICKVSGFR